MNKRNALTRDLVAILSRYSAAELRGAADHIEEISLLVRAAAGKATSKRSARPKRKPATSAIVSMTTPMPDDVMIFLSKLGEIVRNRPGLELRDVAHILGLKEELPKSAKIAPMISDYLMRLTLEERQRKMHTVIEYFESEPSIRGSHYERWVSLITKRP